MKLKLVLFGVILFLSGFGARATTYYVNAGGDDANAGLSPGQAWRTPARVNAAALAPGDRVLFAGGQTFAGFLRVRGPRRGTAARPLVFASYGPGRAVIASDTAAGFYAYNAAGLELRNLAFVGAGRLANRGSGVRFYTDSANARLAHLRLDSLDVSGYRGAGVDIGSWNGTSGYDDVRVTNCQLHANGEAGFVSYAEFPLLGHRDWYVGNCNAYDNSGRPEINNAPTGNGIVLSGVDGAMVEHCTAYHNGWLNARGGGPAGIWGWDCNNLTIQYCESHHNEAAGNRDGGGFDLDGGCTNSVLQYNYSHDNDGPGYLLVQFDEARPMYNLTVRYNISHNDARQLDQGAILLYSSGWAGGIVNANIYNNTILLERPSNGTSPSGVFLLSGDIHGITFRNNILQTATGLPIVRTFTNAGVRFEGNCYWSPAGALTLSWNGASYGSLADWRTASGQEALDNGTRPTGISASPNFTGGMPSSGSSTSYRLDSSSPLLGRGLNLLSEFNLDPGVRDFYGLPTPAAGVSGNIGASESRSPLPVELVSFTVERHGQDALLRWITAQEKKNQRFDVEASTDGRAFQQIGALAGHGTTVAPHNYAFTDKDLARYGVARVYYRLHQIDDDGKVTISPIRTVSVAAELAALAAYPSPAHNLVNIKGCEPDAIISLYNSVGQRVLQQVASATGAAQMQLSPTLPAGVYLIRSGQQSLRLQLE